MDSNTPTTQIGKSVKRLEDPRLLTGNGRYVDDLRLPDTLHLAFVRSDQAHARITRVDYSEALEVPGVVACFSAADLEDMVGPVIADSNMRNYHATPMYPLARDKLRYVGEPVVVIVAESRYEAEDAIDYVVIEYEPLAPLADPEQAAAPDAVLLHEEIGSNILVEREFARGEAEPAMAAAPIRVSGRLHFRRKTPGAIENRVYLAEYDVGRQSFTLHSSTQVPFIIRDALAELLKVPGTRVRVISPDVGGGFGGKTSLYAEEILVCVIARRLGRPVKWTGDRMEDLTTTYQAFDELMDVELGLDEEGHILALRADVIGDAGAYSIYPWSAGIEPVQVISFMPGPYRVPVYHGRVRAVATCKAPMGPYRGVGRPASTLAMERLIDMAARRLSMDPKELRLRNLIQPEEFPYKTAPGIVWDHSAFVECLTTACKDINYDGLRAAQVEARAAGRWVGLGIASYAELTGIGSRISAAPGMPINTGTETMRLKIDPTGAVSAYSAVASPGTGIQTALSQVIADELGARIEDIQITYGDSAAVSHGTGAFASRCAVLAGGAATMAARALREKILRAAAHLLEASADQLQVGQSEVRVIGADRAISFREVARAVYIEVRRIPREQREDLEETSLYDPYFGTTSSATHIVQVEIDPETYAVHLQRYVVAEDSGRIINPMIVDGQIHGAVAQGIGAALFEEVIYDESGQLVTASLADYIMPSAPEVPNIGVAHIEAESPTSLGGYRGVGEGGTIGAPAAIANAISDALAPLGVEVTELPITPERLFRMISQKNHSGEMS